MTRKKNLNLDFNCEACFIKIQSLKSQQHFSYIKANERKVLCIFSFLTFFVTFLRQPFPIYRKTKSKYTGYDFFSSVLLP